MKVIFRTCRQEGGVHTSIFVNPASLNVFLISSIDPISGPVFTAGMPNSS